MWINYEMISKILFPMECRVAVLHGTNVRSEMWRNSQGVVFRRGREAHSLMRGSLLSSQPVTFLVETNPGLATLSHYTMSAILSRVWPSQGKPHRCWANDKHYEMYLSWNQVSMLSSGHTEVVSAPLILQYDQESICSIGDVDNAW